MLLKFKDKDPQLGAAVFIAPTAAVIGDVILGARVNVWFGAVLRGDLNQIVVGAGSSVQDNVVLHVNSRQRTVIGANVIVGHGAVLEGCEIGDGCLIGMNATLLSGAVIGAQSVIAAGTVVREGQIIPPRVLVAGVPAAVKRQLEPEHYDQVLIGIERYQEIMEFYK